MQAASGRSHGRMARAMQRRQAALEGWRESAAAEDHAFLDRMGWRCEGQLAYLADELESRGEAVNTMSLHEEGLRQGVKLLKTGNNP